ncbi:hypothetical protein J9B83_02650 [Marinomonas sp. A79]|uniref:Uncharacterized protein n=1 Tax=Marinomonas vulgaris TaxID=2823372 RepID=A0ABS5H8Q9_9GAMM|nr:hypothetical protein [Marinomonas vulgaris]MBR7887827.1 hypothetical protein [Marinomonas vulgaris]
MNKKQFLNTYKKIDQLDETNKNKAENPPIYRSKQDERLIKDYHFAKFQKNRQSAQNNAALKALLEKEQWDNEDVETLLKSLR